MEHLQAKCNIVPAGLFFPPSFFSFFFFLFLWTIAPLVFKYIGLKALRHLDPCDRLPSAPPPSGIQSSPVVLSFGW